MLFARSVVLGSLALISLTACSSSGGGGEDGDSDGGIPFEGGRASAMIGPEGGSLELGEITLDIPAGALSEEMEIGVEASTLELDGLNALSAAYVFSPSGLTFAVPVELSFELVRGAPGAKLYHGEDLDAQPVEVAGATVRDRKVDAMISGFSYYVVGTRTNPIIDVDEGFDFEGTHYTAGPVSQGIIKGFSYSFADGAGVTDGEGMGHVWYDDSYCITFRPDGTGVLDWAGGTRRRYNELPWIQVDPSPGEAEPAAPPLSEGMEPAGTKLLDPEYDRTSELVAFRWGVRLNDDDTIYEDFSGNYETRVEFEDGSPAMTLSWDPARNTHAGIVPGHGEMTTELPEDNHFCKFREVVSMNASGDQSRCVQTVEEYSGGLTFTKSVCYSHGVVQGPYSMTDMNGVEIESGTFENNRPVGGFMYRNLDGVLQATGTFDEDGMPQGEWKLYDWEGNLATVATFKGGYEASGRGTYYRTLSGPYEKHVTSFSSGATYLSSKGSLLDGKRSGPWQSFSETGLMTSDENYDASVQIPNGEACYSLAEGGFECVPITYSWRNNSFYYDWGGCVSGVNTLTFNTYDMTGSIVTMECFELQGTPDEPVKGPMKSCGSACQQ